MTDKAETDIVQGIEKAIQRRDKTAVESLLATGQVDVQTKNNYFLRRACWVGHLPTVALLLNSGADAKANEISSPETRHDGCPITAAASAGHLDVVKHLQWRGADLHADSDGPLKGAATRGHLEVVRYLQRNGVDIHGNDEYALRHASKGGHLLLVIELLACRANLHIHDDEPLNLACEHGHAPVVRQLLLAGANVHAQGNRALLAAVKAGHPEVVRLLVHAGADVRANDDEPVRRGSAKVLRHLIMGGAEINVSADKPYSTPLYVAISRGYLEKARLLIIAGANVRDESEKLLYAGTVHQKDDLQFLELLIAAGAIIDPPGSKPILDTIAHHNFIAVERLLLVGVTIPANKSSNLVDALLFNRDAYRRKQIEDAHYDYADDESDPDDSNNAGEAGQVGDGAESEDDAISDQAIKSQARLDSALDEAALQNYPVLATYLIKLGANPDAGALATAARMGEIGMARMLVAADADPIVNNCSAIRLADAEYRFDDPASMREEEREEIVQLLLAAGKNAVPDYRPRFSPREALTAAAAEERERIELSKGGRQLLQGRTGEEPNTLNTPARVGRRCGFPTC